MKNKENIIAPKAAIQLNLKVEEVNIILQALGSLPFNQVFELIGEIHDQANAQTLSK